MITRNIYVPMWYINQYLDFNFDLIFISDATHFFISVSLLYFNFCEFIFRDICGFLNLVTIKMTCSYTNINTV